MATAREIKVGSYCNRMFDELTGMKARLLDFVNEIEHMDGPDKEVLITHVAHFQDIAKMIDWKLEILTRVCPYEWTGFTGVETGASVELRDEYLGNETVSGGYIGG